MPKHTHTPGPWRVGMRPGPMVYGPKGEQVTSINVMIDEPENVANCRLIAAAPDMLVALEQARDTLRELGRVALVGDELELACGAEDVINTAIAKAKGE